MPLVCHQFLIAIPFLSSLQPRLVKATRAAVEEISAVAQIANYSIIEIPTLSMTINEQ